MGEEPQGKVKHLSKPGLFKRVESFWQSKKVKLAAYALGGILSISSLALWIHWMKQVTHEFDQLARDSQTTSKDRLDASLEVTKAIIGGLGTVATITGGIVLFLNYRVAAEKLRTDTRQTESRLISERFSKAIEQLGNSQIVVRIGAIYALEKIAEEAPAQYYWTVLEILSSFVQEQSPAIGSDQLEFHLNVDEPEPQSQEEGSSSKQTDTGTSGSQLGEKPSDIANDVLVAMKVISHCIKTERYEEKARRQEYTGRCLVDLKNVDLSGADLRGAHLNRTDLRNANLNKADLSNANLSGADLRGAYLNRASLQEAQLEGSNLLRVKAQEANFEQASLQGTDLSFAILIKACFNGAKFDQKSIFFSADIAGAPLRNITGLTPEKITRAKDFDKADYDEEFERQLKIFIETEKSS